MRSNLTVRRVRRVTVPNKSSYSALRRAKRRNPSSAKSISSMGTVPTKVSASLRMGSMSFVATTTPTIDIRLSDVWGSSRMGVVCMASGAIFCIIMGEMRRSRL